MLIIILLVSFGILAGFLLRRFRAIQKVNSTMSFTIYVMLFILGLTVGADPLIIGNISSFGLQALIISAAGVIGSALCVMLVDKFFFRKGESR